ncbi:MAG: polyhydroxyalkanoic acid system family protein [bacterium]
MPALEMTVAHSLTQDEALRRIKTMLADLRAKHADQITDLNENWDGDTGTFRLSAMGFTVSGKISVKPSEVAICGELPFAASLFKSTIESTIRRQTETLLA